MKFKPREVEWLIGDHTARNSHRTWTCECRTIYSSTWFNPTKHCFGRRGFPYVTYCHILSQESVPILHTVMGGTTQNQAVQRLLHFCANCHLCPESLLAISYDSPPSSFSDRCDSRLQQGSANGENKSAADLRSRMLSCPCKTQNPQSAPYGSEQTASRWTASHQSFPPG